MLRVGQATFSSEIDYAEGTVSTDVPGLKPEELPPAEASPERTTETLDDTPTPTPIIQPPVALAFDGLAIPAGDDKELDESNEMDFG